MEDRLADPLLLSIPPPKLNPVLDLDGLLPSVCEGLGLIGPRLLEVEGGDRIVEGDGEVGISAIILGDSVPLRDTEFDPPLERRRPSRPKNELWEVDVEAEADVSDCWTIEEVDDPIILVLVLLISVPLPLGSNFREAEGNAEGGL